MWLGLWYNTFTKHNPLRIRVNLDLDHVTQG